MWSICSNGTFSVKSLKMHLYNTSIMNNIVNVGSLQTSTLPKKCKVFIWTILHRSLNTADKIQARHHSITLYLNWCVLCRQDIEDFGAPLLPLPLCCLYLVFFAKRWSKFQLFCILFRYYSKAHPHSPNVLQGYYYEQPHWRYPLVFVA